MRRHLGIFDTYNDEDFILFPGRLATAAGLAGLFLGIVITALTIYDVFTIIVVPVLFGYAGLTGYWGVHEMLLWFRKYRYRMPRYVWYLLYTPVVIAGIVLGMCGWGLIEHFILLLAIDAKGGILGSQLVLLPFLGRKLAKILHRTPSGNSHDAYPPHSAL